MRFLSRVFRTLALLLSLAVPLGLVGFCLAGVRGAACGVALWWGVLLYGMFAAEAHLRRVYRARGQSKTSAASTLTRVIARLGGDTPDVVSLGDPSPQALVARSCGSSGTLLLSEGLLGSLNEEELRRLMQAGVHRVRAPGIVLLTLCSWLAHLTLELAPKPWTELVFGELRWHENLGVLGALRFSFFYSLARLFVRLGGRFPDDALQESGALPRMPAITGEVTNPGSGRLHFSSPWAARALFPL